MKTLLLVCLGGAVGSGARHLVTVGLTSWAERVHGSSFPWGTLAVNVIGSFLLGVLLWSGQAEGTGPNSTLRFLVGTGALGGFTTYSTFNYETLCYLQQGQTGAAAANVALTLVTCLLAGVAGMLLARSLLP